MDWLVARLREAEPPPPWTYALVFTVVPLLFAFFLPFGVDRTPDVLIEGLYLAFAVCLAALVRRLHVPLLELGMWLFTTGRLVDFLDELFVEPEPIVEPYLSGLFMLASLVVIVLGVGVIPDERTDRIESLAAQTEELALKNDAMDEAPIGITVADMTRDDEPLVYVNDGFEKLTGYDADQTVGSNCRFLQGEETDPEAVATMREAIDAGEPVQVTLRNYRRDGTEFWNEITLAPIRESGGEATHYVGFQQDVTERMEYADQLEAQRDDLHLLNKMVRHDIRNDLQVLLVHLGILEDHVEDGGRQSLAAVTESARNAVQLTESARDLSRSMLEDDPDLTTRSLSGVLERQVTDTRATYEDVTVVVDTPLPDVTVAADGMLDSVFRNVLNNAVQHNDAEDPEIAVSIEQTDEHAVVTIADNGPGVPEEMRDEIFAEGETGVDSDGTGIGMYLVETLVSEYGGDVWVEDNDPTGAAFKLALPTATESVDVRGA